MRIKPGVSVKGLRAEILLAFVIADPICRKYGVVCWLTSGVEGLHGPGSYHPVGLAIDLRGLDFTPANLDKFVVELRIALGGNSTNTKGEYDVVKEFVNGVWHVHVEHDVAKVKARAKKLRAKKLKAKKLKESRKKRKT